MLFPRWVRLFVAILLAIAFESRSYPGCAQDPQPQRSSGIERSAAEFRDAATGRSVKELVLRALDTNGDLAASRLDVQRARGRLRQAGLHPNPVLEVEESIGRWTGSAGEGGVSVALTWPIELGGKRTKRVDLAQADLLAAEAEVADRERRLAAEVREAFAAAQASLRELEITSELNAIDLQTTKFVESRVQEGDAAPLELSLLRADAERLRSRRALIQGRLEAAILRLKILSGIPAGDILRLKEDINAITLVGVPPLEDAIKDAIATRPDLRLARLNEDVAAAGYRLARAQAKPDLSLSARFSTDGAIFDDTPVGPLIDHDKFLTFGASISLPFRNRNQGAREEAQAEILQARARREFIESQVRAEVSSAYARYEAARAAVAIYETGVIERSAENVKAVRGAYEIGAFRITDLLMEQRRSVDFQIEYTETLAERYRARSALDAAIGVPVR